MGDGEKNDSSAPPRSTRSLTVQDEYIQHREMPERVQGVYRKATETWQPMRAIRAFCLECQGYDMPGVAECEVRGCPLWQYRHGTKRKREDPNGGTSQEA